MRVIGNSYPIHDATAKAVGSAVYAGDMRLPGMLHVAVLFSGIPHGRVTGVDATEAFKVQGVVDVLHCLNTKSNPFSRFRTMRGDTPAAQEFVFSEHVRFVGDRVACVIADTAETARRALKLIKVDYVKFPFSLNTHQTIHTGVIDDLHEEGAVYGDIELVIGDVPTVAGTEMITAATHTHLSRINHMTMEPHACVASYDRAMQELTIWTPNQAVFGIRTVICDMFELPYHKVRVVKTTMGGSFGAKQEWMLEPVAAAAALRCGKPVKLVFSRKEAMVSTINRCPLDADIRTTLRKDGKIQSIEADFTLDAGAYLGNSYDYAVSISSKFFRCYDFPNLSYKGRAVCTNTPVSGAFRGWGGPEMAAALEHNLNMAARKLGMDPAQLRMQNTAKPHTIDKKNGQSLGEIRVKECIEQGCAAFDWTQKRKEDEAFNKDNERFQRGTAIACGSHVNGYFPRKQDFSGVEMRMTETGSVMVNITLHDHGCGTITAFQMIVAETLGIEPGMVQIKEADTAVTPMDVGCFASRTIYVLGRAAQDCAQLLKEKLIENMAAVTGTPREFLYIEDAAVKCRVNPDMRYTYAEASLASIRQLQKEVWVCYQSLNQTNPATTAAHFAHVQVDTYTGMVRLLDYLAVHDIGQVINREITVAQIQGAVMMGAGAALTEHNDVRPDGTPVSSLKDYHLLNAADAPEIRVLFVEDGQTEGPYGAKSVGEMAHVPVAPAVVGAVNEALQSELCHLPVTPDKIIEWLRQRRVRHEA